jgi:hypothetical protein
LKDVTTWHISPSSSKRVDIGEEIFITGELWNSCVEPGRSPQLNFDQPIFVGVDAGIKHDTAAVVAVSWDLYTDKLVLASHKIWKPSPLQPLDIEGTIEWYLKQLYSSARLSTPSLYHHVAASLFTYRGVPANRAQLYEDGANPF